MDSGIIKDLVMNQGADLCGIASKSRFRDAPAGFRPTDIYSKCQSVIVFAKRMPSGPLFAENCVPYTHINAVLTRKVDELGIDIAIKLDKEGLKPVPVPSDDPYEHWEPERSYGRAILSMRHAGYLAGLGVLGKNTLLINKDFGNMIQIGAILVNIELEADPLADYEGCPSNCRLCIDSCPQKALDGKTVNQKLCRPISNYQTEKGYYLKKCSLCRGICPNASGIKRQSSKVE
jgi:epoxyqueuosine reductase